MLTTFGRAEAARRTEAGHGADMREKTEEKTTALRITNQCRSKGGMAYDLRCDGVRLTLLVTGRAGSDDPGEWRVEARGARTAEHVAVVAEWGATREDALRAVGRSWVDDTQTADLRVFDWEAVVGALNSVRAL
jgi:hypothetical protein